MDTVPYGIEDVSIPEYSAKVRLRHAARNYGKMQEAFNTAQDALVAARKRAIETGMAVDAVNAIVREEAW